MKKDKNYYDKLKKACEYLNLNVSDYVEPSELEKSVQFDENANYKALYEEQKNLNEQILMNMGNLGQNLTEAVGLKFEELSKGLSDIHETMDILGESPIHKKKSFDRYTVIDKAVNQSVKDDIKSSYSISNVIQIKALKKYLGNKVVEDLQKGITNGLYERAALQLDANRNLTQELRDSLLSEDKVLIED